MAAFWDRILSLGARARWRYIKNLGAARIWNAAMPVKKRLAKARHKQITPEAVAAFRTCVRQQEVYEACIRDEGCFSTKVGEHCPGCAQYLEAHRVLMGELNLPPWAVSPADVELGEQRPAYLNRDSGLCSAKTWDEALALRRELEAAAGESDDRAQ